MKKIHFCLLPFYLLVGFLGFHDAASAAQAEDALPPNILWISVEDISPLIGVYGDPVVETPVIDGLAAEGMMYTNAFTTAGVCSPSRTAIITGMHQSSIGAHHHRPTHTGHAHKTISKDEPLVSGAVTPYLAVPPAYVKTFPEYLRAGGYYTTNNVKTDYNFGLPASVWDESSREAHWRNRPEGKPFFSVINLTTTHESQVWQSELPLSVDPDSVPVPPCLPDTPVVRRDIAQQYTNIEQMDRQVGQILADLEEDGLADDTIVFFWSDHGGALPRQKSWLYDSGIHVPLIIRWPGEIPPGNVNKELVSFVDLAPTVLSLAGVDIPAHIHGRALLGPKEGNPPEYIYAAADRHDEVHDMMRAVRDTQFKYIRNYFPNQPYWGMNEYRHRMGIFQEILRLHAEEKLEGAASFWMRPTRPPEELYNITEDPHEVHNLADHPGYQAELKRMRGALDQWMDEIDDMGDIPEEQLRERFWPGGEQPITQVPFFVVNAAEDRARTWRREGGQFSPPYTVQITSTTHGASIVYTTEQGEDPVWQLYTGPIRVEESLNLRAKAVRYGYAESDEINGVFNKK